MSENHRTTPKNRPDLLVIERFVSELYALADQVLESIAEEQTLDDNRINWAQHRLDQLIAVQQSPNSPAARHRRHRWLTRVLEDLVAHAEKDQLALIIQKYEDAND